MKQSGGARNITGADAAGFDWPAALGCLRPKTCRQARGGRTLGGRSVIVKKNQSAINVAKKGMHRCHRRPPHPGKWFYWPFGTGLGSKKGEQQLQSLGVARKPTLSTVKGQGATAENGLGGAKKKFLNRNGAKKEKSGTF